MNAIPTLLLHVCDKAEQDAPMLRRVENRDHVLQELAGRHDISTDAANKLVLLTLHFGDLPHVFDAVAQGDDADDDPDEHAAKLIRRKIDHGSVDAVLDELSNEADGADDPNRCLVDECAEAGGNEGGRLVASVCSRLKGDVLNNMRSYFISKKFKVVKVLSEGVAVEILGDRVVNDAVLRDCETTIFQTTGATREETPMPAERRVDPGAVSAKQAPFGFLIQTLATEASGRGLTRMGKHVFDTPLSGGAGRRSKHTPPRTVARITRAAFR